MKALAIESKLTVTGKDKRAISVSGRVRRERVRYTDHAFSKTVVYKGRAANHFVDQEEAFRVMQAP
jgi:hypothetical protein